MNRWHTPFDFIKDFGLILFVSSIGLQVGPGFFSSFKKGGLSLNVMGLAIVFLGGLITMVLHWTTGMSLPMLVGFIGIILTMIAIHKMFRVNVAEELDRFNQYQHSAENLPGKGCLIS
jgi:uncharacterized transporter YbjL